MPNWNTDGPEIREITEAQLAEGGHVLSEIFNDNAPIGEHRYVDALRKALAQPAS